ncbi:MOSC domain-containing protein [Polymorphum gilvum]|uniref:MOSC domain-containing protein n=1 Tax=Polymorphum gilvum (strain LMG 25793 / CGMCC 1.9160 / SL003B-26A1) TaxID=991905 RepID=F2J1E1_POLGS|nr:MOSC domain-containing protein [Polymorphum gilvum]ADZ69723.1 hypothetical protein SL003B_1295 [Polymorphum gilvum SL003B-26A1]
MPADLFGDESPDPDLLVRGRRLAGRVVSVLKTAGAESFETARCDDLVLTFEGIPGDRHAGFTRRSGGREPWYPRGTEMANERQVSVLSAEELALVARRMDLPELRAEWIGGNIVLAGIPRLSLIPPRTRLVFEGGAVLRVDGDNAPCRIAGRAIAARYPERDGLDLLFPDKARRLRGLVAYVERPGTVRAGEAATAHVPEQWIYSPD